MKSLIIIPARNESSTIGNIVTKIKQITNFEVLVVDDASNDNTLEKAHEGGAVTLSLAIQLGAWGATRTGFRYALHNNYDYVITMDADGQHSTESIHLLMTEIQSSNSDVIIGSSTQRGNQYKKLAWYIFRKISLLNIMDLTSGLRIYNRSAVKVLLNNDTALFNYQDIGVLLTLKNSGFRITEVPVNMACRSVGRSKIFNSWFAILKYFLYTFILCIIKIKRSKY